MVIKRGSIGKIHYILPVCNMPCFDQSLLIFCGILYAGDTQFGTFGGVAHPP